MLTSRTLPRQGGTSGGSWLVTLATRGRHFGVTWVISSQCLNLVGAVIRKNVRCMCIWRLRSYREIETLREELRRQLADCTADARWRPAKFP